MPGGATAEAWTTRRHFRSGQSSMPAPASTPAPWSPTAAACSASPPWVTPSPTPRPAPTKPWLKSTSPVCISAKTSPTKRWRDWQLGALSIRVCAAAFRESLGPLRLCRSGSVPGDLCLFHSFQAVLDPRCFRVQLECQLEFVDSLVIPALQVQAPSEIGVGESIGLLKFDGLLQVSQGLVDVRLLNKQETERTRNPPPAAAYVADGDVVVCGGVVRLPVDDSLEFSDGCVPIFVMEQESGAIEAAQLGAALGCGKPNLFQGARIVARFPKRPSEQEPRMRPFPAHFDCSLQIRNRHRGLAGIEQAPAEFGLALRVVRGEIDSLVKQREPLVIVQFDSAEDPPKVAHQRGRIWHPVNSFA